MKRERTPRNAVSRAPRTDPEKGPGFKLNDVSQRKVDNFKNPKEEDARQLEVLGKFLHL